MHNFHDVNEIKPKDVKKMPYFGWKATDMDGRTFIYPKKPYRKPFGVWACLNTEYPLHEIGQTVEVFRIQSEGSWEDEPVPVLMAVEECMKLLTAYTWVHHVADHKKDFVEANGEGHNKMVALRRRLRQRGYEIEDGSDIAYYTWLTDRSKTVERHTEKYITYIRKDIES